MERVDDNSVLNNVLELFKTYQKTGKCSRLVLETMGGALTAHLSVQVPAASSLGCGWSQRTKEDKRPRRITPSRRRRNQARREQWLARKSSQDQESSKDISDDVGDNDLDMKHKEPILAEASKDGKVLTENPRQIICVVKDSVEIDATDTIVEVIEQIDGNIDSTVTYDLTISAETFIDAFSSIEENLCSAEFDPKIPFISTVPSTTMNDDNNEDNRLYTIEVRFDNEKKFLSKIEIIFQNWEPMRFGKPKGTLLKFEKRI